MKTQSWILGILVSVLAFGLSCASTKDEPTTIVLTLWFPDAWNLTQVELASGNHHSFHPEPQGRVHSGDRIRITLASPDEAGKPFPIDVWGIQAGRRIAWGTTEPIPVLNQTVEAAVTLTNLPCGDWCTEGSTECHNGGTRICQVGSDGCTSWSKEIPCGEGTTCSLGKCSKECVNECAPGTSTCAGPGEVRACGESNDGDTCTDWLEATACTNGQVCESDACRDPGSCQDECTTGAKRCDGNGVAPCGQADTDECLEWQAPTACKDGETCEQGACIPKNQCTDQCSANSCDGNTYLTCGNYDDDTCQEYDRGKSCVPTDACLIGSCDLANGCVSTPKACDDPPASTCKNPSTKTVYEGSGKCTAGKCEYRSQDIACPNCPTCGTGGTGGAAGAGGSTGAGGSGGTNPCVPCDPIQQCGCEAGQACEVYQTGNECRSIKKHGNDGDRCDALEDCQAGYTCSRASTWSHGYCSAFCDDHGDCNGPGGKCVIQAMSASVCSVNCDPLSANGCIAGFACDAVEKSSAGVDYTECRPAGSQTHTHACSSSVDCVAGTVCASFDCMMWCVKGVTDCPSGFTCTSFNIPIRIGSKEYGVCWWDY